MASWRTGLHETGVDAIIVTAPAMLGWALLKHFFRKTDVHSWLLRCGQQLAGPAAPIQSTAVEVEKDACRKRLLLENKSPKRIKSAPCLLDTSSFTIDEDDEEDVDKDDEEDDDEDDEEAKWCV
ncbi:hypothetical protein BASA81_000152 [Batrachochytrium salamandrivorans]|nr:hypothetical protein BASA81_000152 [Batrachochytrium salamandrivorans]